MPGQNRSWIAGGDITPSRFVKQVAGTDHTVVIAVADDESVGISYEGTRDAPVDGITPLAAAEGEPVRVYEEGEPCEIVVLGAVAAGDKLKPTANGLGIVAVSGDVYGAVAAAGAASGERCKCTVRRGIVQ